MPRRRETSGISHQISATWLDLSVVKGRRQEICRRCFRLLSCDGMNGFLEISFSLSTDRRWDGNNQFKLAFPLLDS